jgi:hypothetical protein
VELRTTRSFLKKWLEVAEWEYSPHLEQEELFDLERLLPEHHAAPPVKTVKFWATLLTS